MSIPMKVLNLRKPHVDVPNGDKEADYVVQDGVLLAWSEGNIRYETAWWLYAEARENDLVKNLRKERPKPELPQGVVVKGLIS